MYRPSSFFTSLSFVCFTLSHFLYSFVNARTFHSTRCFFHAYTWERISWFSKCNSRNRRRLHSVSCSLGRLCLPRGKWLVFANCFLVDSWRWGETDDEVFEQSRNWEIHRIRVSLFVFSILAGDRRKVKGFPTRLSVKIRDRIVGVFDTERTGGKTLKGKKKRKNAVEAWRVHENVRDRGEERLDEGARSKGSWKGNVNLWDHVDRSHASVSLAFFVYYPPLAFYLRLPVTPSYELVRSIDYF